jgi:hypothetical protein
LSALHRRLLRQTQRAGSAGLALLHLMTHLVKAGEAQDVRTWLHSAVLISPSQSAYVAMSVALTVAVVPSTAQ